MLIKPQWQYSSKRLFMNKKKGPLGPSIRKLIDGLASHRLLQVLVDLVEEAGGREPFLIRTNEQR